METKMPKVLGYLLVLLILALGVFFAGRRVLGPKSEADGVTSLIDEKTRELEEKDRQIQERDDQIAQIRQALEEHSKQVADLKARLDETTKELSSTQKQLKSAKKKIQALAATRARASRRIAPKPIEPASPAIRRRPAEPGTYETIRATTVFEGPIGSSREVATIHKGVKVKVVGSVGEWLEIRSKHGKPPGFIRRDDAMFVKGRN